MSHREDNDEGRDEATLRSILHGDDLVIEIINVQALPRAVRAQAIRNVGRLAAPGGTLFVVAAVHDAEADVDGPPWPLMRAEVESFAADGLTALRIDKVALPGEPDECRWRAEFVRGRRTPGTSVSDPSAAHH